MQAEQIIDFDHERFYRVRNCRSRTFLSLSSCLSLSPPLPQHPISLSDVFEGEIQGLCVCVCARARVCV